MVLTLFKSDKEQMFAIIRQGNKQYRVTEGDTQFYEVSPRSLELGHYVKRGFDRWVSDRNKRN